MSAARKLLIAWHGTDEEALDLLGAISRNCACEVDESVFRRRACSVHRMLVDQRALDGLVFARRARAQWLVQEWAE